MGINRAVKDNPELICVMDLWNDAKDTADWLRSIGREDLATIVRARHAEYMRRFYVDENAEPSRMIAAMCAFKRFAGWWYQFRSEHCLSAGISADFSLATDSVKFTLRRGLHRCDLEFEWNDLTHVCSRAHDQLLVATVKLSQPPEMQKTNDCES